MINHDKYMMINFLFFYEFFYKKYYFLIKKDIGILYKFLYENNKIFNGKLCEKYKIY